MKYVFENLSRVVAAAALGLGLLAAPAWGAESEYAASTDYEMRKAQNLEELLRLVRERRLFESEVNQEREQAFIERKEEQEQMLEDAQAERRREEQRSDRLETQFQENERRIGDLQAQLDERLGALRELFGVLQQTAGDMRSTFNGSIVSAQHPDRGQFMQEFAEKVGSGSKLPSIEEIEQFWYEIQFQMTESGKVVRFEDTVIETGGDQRQTDIIRIGEFNLVADGRYLNYEPDADSIVELARQPSSRFADTVDNLMEADPGELVPFAVDPTRGSLLSLLIQGKTIEERIQDGGTVGYVILSLGAIGVLIALWRLIELAVVSAKVRSQSKAPEEPSESNPLGRILKVYHDNRDVDVETLELKLSEAILGETPRINRGIPIVQVISVVAPLLGLLGTVIGMILTFQAITLFGTGDPQVMAGGISTALMTTVLGLTVAIPTVLLHAIVNGRAKAVVHVLEEQSAGMIAEHAERTGQQLG